MAAAIHRRQHQQQQQQHNTAWHTHTHRHLSASGWASASYRPCVTARAALRRAGPRRKVPTELAAACGWMMSEWRVPSCEWLWVKLWLSAALLHARLPCLGSTVLVPCPAGPPLPLSPSHPSHPAHPLTSTPRPLRRVLSGLLAGLWWAPPAGVSALLVRPGISPETTASLHVHRCIPPICIFWRTHPKPTTPHPGS